MTTPRRASRAWSSSIPSTPTAPYDAHGKSVRTSPRTPCRRRDRAPQRPGGARAGSAGRGWPVAGSGPDGAVDAARAGRTGGVAGGSAAGASVAGADSLLAVRATASGAGGLHADGAAAGGRGGRGRLLRAGPVAAPDGVPQGAG